MQAARSFRGAMLAACAFSVFSVAAGLGLAYGLDWPASGTIVLCAFAIFAAVFVLRRKH